MPGKYSGINGIVDNNFTIVNSVHPTLRDSCARIINQSSATNSWNQLRSVLKLTKRLQAESGVSLCLPWDQASVLNFILLMAQKQHKHSTIRVYVSRLRWWHKLQGTIYLFFFAGLSTSSFGGTTLYSPFTIPCTYGHYQWATIVIYLC